MILIDLLEYTCSQISNYGAKLDNYAIFIEVLAQLAHTLRHSNPNITLNKKTPKERKRIVEFQVSGISDGTKLEIPY